MLGKSIRKVERRVEFLTEVNAWVDGLGTQNKSEAFGSFGSVRRYHDGLSLADRGYVSEPRLEFHLHKGKTEHVPLQTPR